MQNFQTTLKKGSGKSDLKQLREKTNLKEFGAQLKKFRIGLQDSQAKFANKLGFTRTYINELENGKWIPSNNFWVKLTEQFPEVTINVKFFKNSININVNKNE